MRRLLFAVSTLTFVTTTLAAQDQSASAPEQADTTSQASDSMSAPAPTTPAQTQTVSPSRLSTFRTTRDSIKTKTSHTSTMLASDGGYRFDFQDADIKAVITALAAAGNLNVAYGDLPPKKVSLRLNHSVQASEIPSILRNVALTNGLKVSEDQGLITISTIAPPVPNRRTGPSLDGTQLYVYRLKHADASTLATLLQGIFTTSSGGAATPRFNGGVGGAGANGTNNQRGRNRTTGAANGTGGLGGGGLGGNGGGGTLGGGGFGGGGGGFGGGGFGGGGFGGGGFGGGTFGQGQNGRGGGFTFQLPFSLTGANDEAIIIAPDETTNSLLVRATPDDWSVIKEAIEAVDLRPLQVVIEVMIAEVQRDDDLTFGVSGSASNARTSTNGTVAGGTLGPAPDSSDNFVLNLSRRGAVDVNVAIRALQTRGNVKILSLPLVFAQNNKESALIVGTEQPFVQSYQTGLTAEGVQNQVVQYREVGTMLDIVPTINPDGYVNLDVYQEVSSATNQVQFGAPVISTRQASASVFVKNGQTIVVGGLTDRQQQDTRQGIPLLSAIPWLGALFGTTTHTAQRTELYLFLTPHIVESDMDAEHIRQEIGKNSKLMEKLPVDSVRVIDPEGNDPHPQGPPVTPATPTDSSTMQQAAPPPRMRMYPGRPRQQQ